MADYFPESRVPVIIVTVVTIDMKIYKIRVLDLSFPHRAFVSSSVGPYKTNQRYLCQLRRVGVIVSPD